MTRRSTVLVGAGLIVGNLAATAWHEVIAGAIGAVLLAVLAPVPVGAIRRRMRPFLYFALVTLAIGGLGQGRTVATLGPLHWGAESVQAAGIAAVRLLTLGAVFSWVSLRVGASRMVAHVWSLGRRLKRRGVNADLPLLAFAVAIRFLPLLQDEGRRLRLAWEARGGSVRSLTDRVKGAAALTIPLLAAALRRAEDFANAVDVRTRGGGMAPPSAFLAEAAGEEASVRPLIPEGRFRAAACAVAAWAAVLAKVWNWF